MKIEKEYLNLLKKAQISATKKNFSKIEGIYRTQKDAANFLSKKENIIMFFILEGFKKELKKDIDENADRMDKVANYLEGHNFDIKIIALDKFVQFFEEKVYFFASHLISNPIGIIENPESFQNLLTYLLNYGIDSYENYEDLTYTDVYNILLKSSVGFEGDIIVDAKPPYSFILDGSNISRNKKNMKEQANMQDVIRCQKKLMFYGVPKEYIFIIFGSGIRHYVREIDKVIFENLLKENNVNQAPIGRDDDWFIIDFARNNNSYIITNDYYREYRKKNPDLADFIESNSIRYTCMGNQISFEEDFEEKLKSIKTSP